VLPLVVRFIVLDINDYFVLATFQMARSTLYVAWHVVFFVGDYNVNNNKGSFCHTILNFLFKWPYFENQIGNFLAIFGM